jgi:hypothetical protein
MNEFDCSVFHLFGRDAIWVWVQLTVVRISVCKSLTYYTLLVDLSSHWFSRLNWHQVNSVQLKMLGAVP